MRKTKIALSISRTRIVLSLLIPFSKSFLFSFMILYSIHSIWLYYVFYYCLEFRFHSFKNAFNSIQLQLVVNEMNTGIIWTHINHIVAVTHLCHLVFNTVYRYNVLFTGKNCMLLQHEIIVIYNNITYITTAQRYQC